MNSAKSKTLKLAAFRAPQLRRALFTIFLPLLAPFLAVAWHIAVVPVQLLDVALLMSMSFLTLVGVEIGYHRYFSHRSFDAAPWLQLVLGVLGSMAGQGPVRFWSATHRLHHECGDLEGDPHSPHVSQGQALSALPGLWHAHVGWMFSGTIANPNRYIPDLMRDRVAAYIQRTYLFWFSAGWVIPAVIGLAVQQQWTGAVSGWLWGGLLRQFAVSNSTWAANSLLHRFGARRFATRDDSRDFAPLALVTLGQSLHNAHHAFPYAADLRVRPLYFDSAAWLIHLFAACGWVRNIKTTKVRS